MMGMIPSEGGTRICPQCGKRMIKRYEPRMLASYPPQYPWFWWCKCGHTEAGGVDRGMTDEEVHERLWEEANDEPGKH